MSVGRAGLVALVGLLSVAGLGRGSASATGVLVTPKCIIAAYACADAVVEWYPPPPDLGFDSGSGTIVSSPPGLDCTVTLGIESGTCTHSFSWPSAYKGEDIEVIATPSTGSLGCAATAGLCDHVTSFAQAASEFNVGVSRDGAAVPVTFALARETVSVTRSGTGTGTVTASESPAGTGKAAPGIDCGGQCSAQFDYGVPSTLTATPDAGASFIQWTGACAGQGATCTITPTAATSTNAVFGLAGQSTTTTKTTTTTASTTTTTTSAPPSTTTTRPIASHALSAQLIAMKSGKSRLGVRIERVEIQTGETVTALLVLTRNGKQVTRASIPGVRPGDQVLTLPIPGSTAAGKATLTLTLTDTLGNHRTWSSAVNLPR